MLSYIVQLLYNSCTTLYIVTFPTINDSTRYVYKWIVSYAYYLVQLLCKSPQSCTGPTDRGCAKRCMHTRVQQRVLYSESAQVRLGEGRGRFDDKKIRVGPAYQAVIPVLGSCSRVDETARAGVEMARTKQTASLWWPSTGHIVVEFERQQRQSTAPSSHRTRSATAAAADEAGATPAAAAAPATASKATGPIAAAPAPVPWATDPAPSPRRSTRERRTPAEAEAAADNAAPVATKKPPTTRKPAAAQPTAPGPEELEEVGGLLEDHGKLLTTDIQTDPGLGEDGPGGEQPQAAAPAAASAADPN